MHPIALVLGSIGLLALFSKKKPEAVLPPPVIPVEPPIIPITPVKPPATKPPATKPPAVIPKPKGTSSYDSYGKYLLDSGTNDEIYAYAISSPSLPFLRDAANRLAEAGDTRAMELTARLSELS